LEVLKKLFRKLAAPASHRIWNVTFCDENVTGVTTHSFLVNFVPVTHSKPLVGLGSGNIWARNERQSLVLPIERKKSNEIGVSNLKPKNFGKKASEDACGRALTSVRIAFTRIGGTGMSEQHEPWLSNSHSDASPSPLPVPPLIHTRRPKQNTMQRKAHSSVLCFVRMLDLAHPCDRTFDSDLLILSFFSFLGGEYPT